MGYFITFEGGEGTGKSTQVRILDDYLRKNRFETLVSREPGGTAEGEIIRGLLVAGEVEKWSSNSEMLLNFAAREVHLNQKIRPALEAGKVVISDRFIDSTAVYQCYAGNGDWDLFSKLNTLIVGDTMPHLTFVLDVDPAIGVGRSKTRMANLKITSDEIYDRGIKEKNINVINVAAEVESMSNEDRFERMDYRFHNNVRKGFQVVVEKFPDRCVLIDASTGIEAVSAQVIASINSLVGRA